MKRTWGFLIAGLVFLVAAQFSAPAFSAEKDAEEEGFSAYSVARLKVFSGTAWVRLPDSGEWEEYATNTPISEKSRISVPSGSEAELQFHGGQYVLLTGGTEVDVRKLDAGNSSFRLRSGEIRFDLPQEDFSPVAVVVPGGGKASFPVPGRYWLTVREAGGTRLVVRRGDSSVSVEKGDFRVKAGEAAMIGQDVRISAYVDSSGDKYVEPPPLTEQERKAEVPPAAAQELRNYGEWVQTVDYGYVWRPRVVTGWSPYYYGSWVWVSPYGWTWVSNEPWGWYPYHYGWWVSDPVFGWVWSPYRSFVSVGFVFGSFSYVHYHRNVMYYPATVRFVRDGGYVRWVPLRVGERFVRSGFTRSNARLSRWDRPLERGTVFERSPADSGGKAGWREWSVSQRRRGDVVVRERAVRQGEAGRRGPASRDERPGVRQAEERNRPHVQEHQPQRNIDRQERPQRNMERRERPPQRDMHGPKQSVNQTTRPAKAQRVLEKTNPRAVANQGRREHPAMESAQPRVEAPPPYRGEVRGQPPARIQSNESAVESRGREEASSQSGVRNNRDSGGDRDRGSGGRGGRR